VTNLIGKILETVRISLFGNLVISSPPSGSVWVVARFHIFTESTRGVHIDDIRDRESIRERIINSIPMSSSKTLERKANGNGHPPPLPRGRLSIPTIEHRGIDSKQELHVNLTDPL